MNVSNFDRYALFLRPLDKSGEPLVVPVASESQAKWGGIHVTLCGFSPKAGCSAAVTHATSLVQTLDEIHAAVAAQAQPGFCFTHWQLSHGAALEAYPQMLMLPRDSKALQEISKVVTSRGLVKPRTVAAEKNRDRFHMSIGTADHEVVRKALLACQRWEVVIAKCEGGSNLQVSDEH